ncbi:aldo/keto reductase [Desertimonas flava]|uniref:aldo/keto reductase n=1 Tax=Desertimonas flava TaxID=2064846 RepID=UPI000E355ED2|nr:aldo/keto reductase [Desertimonas flava]
MLERLMFGRTGHESTRLIFGAAGIGWTSQEHADAVLEQVRAAGINHLDTAASYGDAEVRMAPFLRRHRADYFLATKTGERTGDAARAELERSLERLEVDQVDLIQLHNLVEADEFDVAHGPGGAVEALVRARDEGLVRFIGVTGHGVRIAEMHRRSLERHDFDSVLLPYNHLMMRNADYRRHFEALVDECQARQVAVQTIKAVARRRWTTDGDEPHRSWYEPLPPGPALARAVAFVLARPGLFLNTSSDTRLLDAIVAAATGPCEAPSDEDLDADARTHHMAPLFDGHELETI